MVAPGDASGHLQVDDAVAHPVAPDGLAQGDGQRRAGHGHGDAQLAKTALQPGEVALGVGQLAFHHGPHFVDPVAELVAAVLDRNPRFRLAQEAAVHIGQTSHRLVFFELVGAGRTHAQGLELAVQG